MSARATYRVPQRFFDDHVERDCSRTSRIVGEEDGLYLVEMDGDGWSDLESDADYYVSMGVSELGREYMGLVSSARATLKRLRDQGPPVQ